jgi:hypothetical protein
MKKEDMKMGKRNLKRKMKRMKSKGRKTIAEKFMFLWVIHFGHTGLSPGEGAFCEKCFDYIEMGCPGGKIPEECMIETALAGNFTVL